jgi:hypothetical protein
MLPRVLSFSVFSKREWVFAAFLLFGITIQARATTYSYDGQPFSTYGYYDGLSGLYTPDQPCTDPVGCAGNTALVTFQSNTSHFSGTLSLSNGDTATLSASLPPGDLTTTLLATSFTYPGYTIWFNSPADTYGYRVELTGTFKFVDGQITAWLLYGDAGQVGCGGGPGCAAGSSYAFSSKGFGLDGDVISAAGYLTSVIGNGPVGTWQQVAAIPELSTWAMLILGFAGIGAMTYRRRNGAGFAGLAFVGYRRSVHIMQK